MDSRTSLDPKTGRDSAGVMSGMRSGSHTMTTSGTPRVNAPGWLGNPFPLANKTFVNSAKGIAELKDVISKFQEAFLHNVETYPAFRNAVIALKGQKIGYHQPNTSAQPFNHLEVIRDWLATNPEERSVTPVFDSLPAHDPKAPRSMTYAGVGSRDISIEEQKQLTEVAALLYSMGYTLQSGGAEGSDKAFEAGAKDKKAIFYADDKNGHRNAATDKTRAVALEIHPAPAALQRMGQKAVDLMARNTNQVFGANLDTPVDFLVAWTKDGITSSSERTQKTGGTGQAIDMASRKGIPVFNLNSATGLADLKRHLQKIGAEVKKPEAVKPDSPPVQKDLLGNDVEAGKKVSKKDIQEVHDQWRMHRVTRDEVLKAAIAEGVHNLKKAGMNLYKGIVSAAVPGSESAKGRFIGTLADYKAAYKELSGKDFTGAIEGGAIELNGKVYADVAKLGGRDSSRYAETLLHEFGHILDKNQSITKDWKASKDYKKESEDLTKFIFGDTNVKEYDEWKVPHELVSEFNVIRHLIPAEAQRLAPTLKKLMEAEYKARKEVATNGYKLPDGQPKVIWGTDTNPANAFNTDDYNSSGAKVAWMSTSGSEVVAPIKVHYAKAKLGGDNPTVAEKIHNKHLLFSMYEKFLRDNPEVKTELRAGLEALSAKGLAPRFYDTSAKAAIDGKSNRALGGSQIYAAIFTAESMGTTVTEQLAGVKSFSGLNPNFAPLLRDVFDGDGAENVPEMPGEAPTENVTQESEPGDFSFPPEGSLHEDEQFLHGGEDVIPNKARTKENPPPTKPEAIPDSVMARDRDIFDLATRAFKTYPSINFQIVDAPSDMRSPDGTGPKDGDKAWSQDNMVTLFRKNLKTKQDVLDALFHETVAHVGLRQVLGDKYEAIALRIWKSAQSNPNQGIKDLVAGIQATYKGAKDIELADEFLGHMAEQNRKLITAMKQSDVKALKDVISDKNANVDPVELLASARRELQQNHNISTPMAEKGLQMINKLAAEYSAKPGELLRRSKYTEVIPEATNDVVDVLKELKPGIQSLQATDRINSRGGSVGQALTKWYADHFHHKIGDVTRTVKETLDQSQRRIFAKMFKTVFKEFLDATPDGRKHTTIQTIFSSEKKMQNALATSKIAEAADELLNEGEVTTEIGKSFVEAMKQFNKYISGYSGISGKMLETHIPHVVDREKMLENKEEVLKIIGDFLSKPDADGNRKKRPVDALSMFEHLTHSQSLTVIDEDIPMAPGFNFTRGLPKELRVALKEYYVKDLDTLLLNYMQAGIKRAVFNDAFGDWVEDPGTNDDVFDPVAKLKAMFDAKEADGSAAFSAENLKYFTTRSLPAHLGTMGADMSDFARSFNSWAITYMNFTILPLSIFANIVDVAGTVIRSGEFKAPIQEFFKVLGDKQYREGLQGLMDDMGMLQHDMVDHVLQEQAGFMSNTPAYLNQKLFTYNGMRTWNNFSRTVAYATARRAISGYAKKSKDASLTAKERQIATDSLRELGITSQQVEAWEKEGMDTAAHPEMARALDTWTDGAIVRPDASLRPALMSDPRLAMLTYLKGFMWAIYQVLTVRVMHSMSQKDGFARLGPAAQALTATAPLSMLGLVLRQTIASAGSDDDERRKRALAEASTLLKLVLRSGLLGVGQLPVDMYEADKRGHLAVAALVGPFGTKLEDLFTKNLIEYMETGTPLLSQSKYYQDIIRKVAPHEAPNKKG